MSEIAPPAFTVVMPLWRGDRADRFRSAVRSATLEQELRPARLIVTVDGPVGEELERELADVEAGELGPALVLRHDVHRGLAPALQDALGRAETEIVARADADDLCRPERFARQIPALVEGELDLLGCAMQEFSDEIAPGTGPLRRRPLAHDEILAYLPVHSPFHHPTVVMRAPVALAAGGYRELDHLEDYWLWERMVLAGARCGNLPDVLVDYRVDDDLFARRGGWGMLVSDVRLQRMFLRDGVIGPWGLVRNLASRGAYRLVPGPARRFVYRAFVEPFAPRRR